MNKGQPLKCLSEGDYTVIPNQVIEALCRTKLPSYASRIILAIFRKTHGFQKEEDWIALSQFEKLTGIRRPHICRTIRQLLLQRIITKRGNKVSINDCCSQWKELPNQVKIPTKAMADTKVGIQELPVQVTTKETHTKENSQKIRDEKILKWFKKSNIGNPKAYLAKIKSGCSEKDIDKAWRDATKQSGIESPTAFYARCFHYAGRSQNSSS